MNSEAVTTESSTKLEQAVQQFEGIDLAGLNAVKLMNRIDTKTYFSKDLLYPLLEQLSKDYYLLDIKGERIAFYKNLYYDTPQLGFYTAHHNRKGNRYKIRYRQYVSSKLTFFEVKFKSNKGRTIKERIKIPDIAYTIKDTAKDLLEDTTPLLAKNLTPSIHIDFNRITFANRDLTERATIDLGLSFKSDLKSHVYDDLVICEIKQSSFNSQSLILKALSNLNIPPKRISKYCIGILSCCEGIKYNRFKRKINQLTNGIY